jgi:hypothetical protein
MTRYSSRKNSNPCVINFDSFLPTHFYLWRNKTNYKENFEHLSPVWTHHSDIIVDHTKGSYIYATDDRKIWDFACGIGITTPVYNEATISVQSSRGQGQSDLPVYVFNGTTYTGLIGVTGEDGTVTLWIPAGSYRFRADQFELQFFSVDENHCTIPECTTALVSTMGMQQVEVNQTIDYTYDPLNRLPPRVLLAGGLTGAVYDDGVSTNTPTTRWAID